jgi:putative inorganic carbon (hco3(-)) transporter
MLRCPEAGQKPARANQKDSLTKGSIYEKPLVYGGGMAFILANGILMLLGFYYLPLLPLITGAIYLAFFATEKLFMTIVFLTPLSVGMSRFIPGLPADLSLPTEPLIVLVMIIFLLRLAHDGSLNREVILHPVSMALLFYLAWMLVTTLTSSMLLVSLKYLLVRLWFIVVFYFLGIRIFSKKGNITLFLWCYMAALLLVVIYTLYRHSGYGFASQVVPGWVVRPFYNDHTAYGAALAMFIPVLAVFAFRGKISRIRRCLALSLLGVFLVALFFSYSRAAWLSIVAALAIWTIIRLKIPVSTLFAFSLIALVLILVLRRDIVRVMEQNRQDSSANFTEHVRSITNITSDASNLERINRWKSAIRMFRERPLLGWGPGTYMFQYAPFQYSYDRTIISTNLSDGGDAHSEYISPLAESGLPGMLSFLLVVFFTLLTGFRLLGRLKKRNERLMVTGILLGLITYMVHGGLNNFLHTDKAAVPFWGFIAILVTMDLYRAKRQAAPAD